MHNRRILLSTLLFVGLLSACNDGAFPPPSDDIADPSAVTQSESASQTKETGTIEGRVTWDGPVPDVPPFVVLHSTDVPAPGGTLLTHEQNPFRPLISPTTKGLRDVVVFLRGVDAGITKLWPHGPVRIEQRHRRLIIAQDGTEGRVGFVRRADGVEVVSRDREFHALRVRGAAFFSLPFVAADRPTYRRLNHAGIVELNSAAGFFWMQAHLFVADHPYFARTDDDGRFRLAHVPTGHFEVVCWMPSWRVVRKDHDPESAMVSRVAFAPPVEQGTSVVVRAGETNVLRFAWTERQGLPPQSSQP